MSETGLLQNCLYTLIIFEKFMVECTIFAEFKVETETGTEVLPVFSELASDLR